MKRSLYSVAASIAVFALSATLPSGCGTKTGTGFTGNIVISSNPLAGPNAAALERFYRTFPLFQLFSLEASAFAGVSSFVKFKVCNDTFLFIDGNGNSISLSGSTSSHVGRGLLTFSPTSADPMVIGSLNIPAGTVIKEVDITFAVVPDVCQGANYAVEFDSGSGSIDITQNTAFKFAYSGTPLTVSGSPQNITLLFGQIVNGMVSLGTGLNNSTIQTVNVGQAK